ncbi:MAG: hypothetical protein ACK5JM_06605 [Rhodoblastus sp.]
MKTIVTIAAFAIAGTAIAFASTATAATQREAARHCLGKTNNDSAYNQCVNERAKPDKSQRKGKNIPADQNLQNADGHRFAGSRAEGPSSGTAGIGAGTGV